MAVNWAYGVGTSVVVDVGHEKTDITPILDFIICDAERDTIPVGGEDMTQHLVTILGGEEKGWGHDAAEQLKCSHICEILDLVKYPIAGTLQPDIPDPLRKQVKLSAGGPLEEDEEEGVTNVAAIVASGKTREYLAKKEKERQDAQRGAQKNQPNHRREFNKFWLIEKRKDGDVVMTDCWDNSSKRADIIELDKTSEHGDEAPNGNTPWEQPQPQQASIEHTSLQPNSDAPAASSNEQTDATTDVAPTSSTPPPPSGPRTAEQIEAEVRAAREKEKQRQKEREKRREEKRLKEAEATLGPNEVRREVEVGLERFRAAECGILNTLADAIYRIISKVDDIARRQELWDSMIIVGNGSKIRGES